MNLPRLVIAGLSGGTGKTIVSLSLCRAWANAGIEMAPFKKGPDYIDAAWLAMAGRNACSNLDPYFLSPDRIRSQFAHYAQGSDVSLIEGNRGLFDGKDEHGTCSTAELARQLDAPVVLAIDCTKMTRTVAAIIQGCLTLEKDINLAGVVCNRTAGERHRAVLRKSIETNTDVPVLGMLPKFRENPIPERHMGLVPDQEYEGSGDKALDDLAAKAADWLDIDRILEIAASAPALSDVAPLWSEPAKSTSVRIGYVLDDALWFYYRENFEALERAGAELVRLSLLDDKPWPDMDGLYLGGGFPETMAAKLSADKLAQIRKMSRVGMPIYAECGGFMILGETLEFAGKTHPMAGVFPVGTAFCRKPQALGYTEAEALSDTPFHRKGDVVLGHEFHYSQCVDDKGEPLNFGLRMKRGKGMLGEHDGLMVDNTCAGYNHIHALAVPSWAPRFVEAAEKFRNG